MPPARKNPQKDSLAGAAGDRVRAIIEAAETSAEAIRAEAEVEAERIRVQAEERATALRSEVRSDVQGLLGSIRDAVDRLRSDLEALERRLGEPDRRAVGTTAPVSPPPPEIEPELALAEDAAAGPAEAALSMTAEADVSRPAEAASSRPAEAAAASSADLEAARLVALNMALDGASREQVDRHLRDNHGVSEPAPLLDEVYESIGRS